MSRVPWKRILGALLVAAAAGYLALTIADNWQQMRAFDWRVRPLWLAASVVAHVLVLSGGVWLWSRVLRHFGGTRVPVGALLRMWFLSNLARYVPGKVFQFVALAQLGRAAGFSAAVLLTSLLVHTGMALLSAAVVAAWTLGDVVAPAVGARWAGAAVTAGALLAVHPGVINGIIGVVPRLLKRPLMRWSGSWLDGAVLLALSAVSWAAYGVAYHLFLASLAEVPWRLVPQLAGVNSLSFVIGYVSLLPGGIGVREVAMAELLRPFVPGGVGAVLAVGSRLWTIATELAGAAAAVAIWGGAPAAAPEEARNGG